VVVAHGLDKTPTNMEISLSGLVNPATVVGGSGSLWVTAPTSTTFTINTTGVVSADYWIAWRADLENY
jgi:hypothetical protein